MLTNENADNDELQTDIDADHNTQENTKYAHHNDNGPMTEVQRHTQYRGP